MSDLVKELLSRSSGQDGIGWTPTTVVPVPAGLLHRAADEIERLRAALDTVRASGLLIGSTTLHDRVRSAVYDAIDAEATAAIDLIRAETLEEAAGVIDENMLCEDVDGTEVLLPRGTSGNKVGVAYAAAIRALKENK